MIYLLLLEKNDVAEHKILRYENFKYHNGIRFLYIFYKYD